MTWKCSHQAPTQSVRDHSVRYAALRTHSRVQSNRSVFEKEVKAQTPDHSYYFQICKSTGKGAHSSPNQNITDSAGRILDLLKWHLFPQTQTFTV